MQARHPLNPAYLTRCRPAARSVEELFPLFEFCKNGDLKAVSDWIAKGNPLDLPPGKKTRRASLLQIAIEKGFLTLTETLLDAGADPSANGNALSVAVDAKRINIVRLLLDRGADPITGYPIYCGFQNRLNPIIAVYKANIDKVPALQLQADMALRYFAKEGNLQCVSLLLWAGARPGVKIPEDDSTAGFSDSCAFEEVVRAGQLDVLKKSSFSEHAIHRRWRAPKSRGSGDPSSLERWLRQSPSNA